MCGRDLGRSEVREPVTDQRVLLRHTAVGPIPADWEVVRLGDLACVRYGKAKPQVGGNVPVVGSGGIYGETKQALVDSPTLVIGRKGSAGSVWLLERACWPADTTFYLEWRRPVDIRFLYGYITLNPLSGEHAKTTLPSLQKADLENLLVPLPPLPEQRAISGVLRTVQQAIAATEQVIATARELKRSLMRYLFTNGPVAVREAERITLRETEIGSVPEHWEVLQLGSVARIERGKFAYRPRNDPRFYGGTIPFIQTGDVAKSDGWITTYSQTLNDLGLSISRVFPKGTIVMTIAANIGYTGILEFDSAFPDSLIGITPDESLDRVFLNYYFQTQQRKMDEKAPRGTQKNINIQFLEPWPVPRPPMGEQRDIARELRAADRKIVAEETRKGSLEDLFKTLLHHLMTGWVRVSH